MKIAQVVCVYPPYRGGIGKVAEDYNLFLTYRGHEVTVFVPEKKNINYKDSNVVALKAFISFGNAALLLSLAKKLKKYDLVYLHYPFFGSAELIYILKALFRYKFKLIVHYHMDTTNLGFLKQIFTLPDRFVRKRLVKIADKIVCATTDYVQVSQIADIYKKYPSKFVSLPFSVDTDKFVPQDRSDDKIQISFVGGMDKAHNFKGVDILIKAFSKLDKKNLVLNLVGNGELIDKYKDLSKKLGVADKVNFLENIDNHDLANIYATSDIFVLASINSHEAFGIVLLEAMSSGAALIASALPGVRSVFEDGVHGLYVQPGSVDDLQKKLLCLIEDKNLRESMSKEGRVYALKKYSQQAARDNLNKIIMETNENSDNK